MRKDRPRTTTAKRADDYWPLRERTKETATHNHPQRNHEAQHASKQDRGAGAVQAPAVCGPRTPHTNTQTKPTTTNPPKPLRNNTPTTTNITHGGCVPCGGLVNGWERCVRRGELPCRVGYGTELVGRCATWGSYIYVVRVVFGGLCRRLVAGRGFTCRLLSTHPVAAVGFPAFVYGAGSARCFVCRPRGFVPLFLLAG